MPSRRGGLQHTLSWEPLHFCPKPHSQKGRDLSLDGWAGGLQRLPHRDPALAVRPAQGRWVREALLCGLSATPSSLGTARE